MKHILIGLIVLLGISASAQNTVAKFKYEDAERAFYDNKFEDCIKLLTETEALLGQTAPNILHLRIMAEHKLFKSNPYESFEKLEQIRNHCTTYLINYDIAGLEEKYRDVYNIQNSLNEYPQSRASFDEKVNLINREADKKAAEQEKVYVKNRMFIDSLLPMVLVEGGTFLMGLKNEKELKWIHRSQSHLYKDAMPQHQVTINAFKIAILETTNQIWNWVFDITESINDEDSKKPVVASWDVTQEFILKLNIHTGRNYRLPTEAEWEYAARGGNKSKNYQFSGSDNKNEVSWNDANASFFETKTPKSHNVGLKAANELGIYDMTGNVWEWCSDWYAADYYNNSPSNNPLGPDNGNLRVARGGSVQCNFGCYTVNRTLGFDLATGFVGFRLVME
ncbi:formylglycine-generating enzyme required for sulfatase activity [Flavobacteriaceae bacterium MAR_2010_72]|nr:formylglycine-generating enzyme required for sulfatase activity [Flavobacteriaceae bacterium MAR_2010_72]TVZ57629.1 formylglycine-generating enzyme required for sulfatase activity [Flavobacteriaceae bacterium MAR_2010_105]